MHERVLHFAQLTPGSSGIVGADSFSALVQVPDKYAHAVAIAGPFDHASGRASHTARTENRSGVKLSETVTAIFLNRNRCCGFEPISYSGNGNFLQF
jgi:hypothetical protein